MYNNPYYYPYMNGINYMNPMASSMGAMALRPKGGLFKGLANIKWGTVLNNTQKTLNVINQAIPVYYQVKPIFGNIMNFGRLLTAFNAEDSTTNQNNVSPNKENNEIKKENKNSPTFFIN